MGANVKSWSYKTDCCGGSLILTLPDIARRLVKKLFDMAEEAGADCIYPIGPGDKETVTTLRNRITSPINILASAQAEPLTILQKIGINRVSFGPFVFRSCLKKFIDIADELLDLGDYACFKQNMMSKSETDIFLIEENE